MDVVFCPPDVSANRYDAHSERLMELDRHTLFQAWTERFDLWFAKPDSLLMTPVVNDPFFFQTEFDGRKHPHYGRFLRLEPDHLVEMTWVTGETGTDGAETVVTVVLTPDGERTYLHLTHAGFLTEAARDRHRDAWFMVLEHMERQLLATQQGGGETAS